MASKKLKKPTSENSKQPTKNRAPRPDKWKLSTLTPPIENEKVRKS